MSEDRGLREYVTIRRADIEEMIGYIRSLETKLISARKTASRYGADVRVALDKIQDKHFPSSESLPQYRHQLQNVYDALRSSGVDAPKGFDLIAKEKWF